MAPREPTASNDDDLPPEAADEEEVAEALDDAEASEPEPLEAESGAALNLDEPGPASRYAAGTEIIKRFQATLPNAPGVYRMFDAEGTVLYVGKAKSLKKRVASYVRGFGHTNRIARMIADTA